MTTLYDNHTASPRKEPMQENAFAIMAKTVSTLKAIIAPQERIDEYLREAMSGDYENLLQVNARWTDGI